MVSRRGFYGLGTATLQELTLYPKKKSEYSLLQDSFVPFVEDKFPSYYFDRLEKKSKRKKYQGLPIQIQNSLRELERRGK